MGNFSEDFSQHDLFTILLLIPLSLSHTLLLLLIQDFQDILENSLSIICVQINTLNVFGTQGLCSLVPQILAFRFLLTHFMQGPSEDDPRNCARGN